MASYCQRACSKALSACYFSCRHPNVAFHTLATTLLPSNLGDVLCPCSQFTVGYGCACGNQQRAAKELPKRHLATAECSIMPTHRQAKHVTARLQAMPVALRVLAILSRCCHKQPTPRAHRSLERMCSWKTCACASNMQAKHNIA